MPAYLNILYPNTTFLYPPYLNRSAVYFETKQFDECIADCDQAVDKGRETRADFKIIAKALARKASALVQLGR